MQNISREKKFVARCDDLLLLLLFITPKQQNHVQYNKTQQEYSKNYRNYRNV